MIHVERKKPGKQTLVVIILAALLVVLMVGTIIAKTVIDGANVALQAKKHMDEYGLNANMDMTVLGIGSGE